MSRRLEFKADGVAYCEGQTGVKATGNPGRAGRPSFSLSEVDQALANALECRSVRDRYEDGVVASDGSGHFRPAGTVKRRGDRMGRSGQGPYDQNEP